jgi:hypothetical protein
MLQDGTIEGRPGDDDPGAIALLRKLSTNQRKRWPASAAPGPDVIPPQAIKKKTKRAAPATEPAPA